MNAINGGKIKIRLQCGYIHNIGMVIHIYIQQQHTYT